MSENAATVAAVNLTRRQNSFHSHPIDLYQRRGALGKLQLFFPLRSSLEKTGKKKSVCGFIAAASLRIIDLLQCSSQRGIERMWHNDNQDILRTTVFLCASDLWPGAKTFL